MNTRPRHRFSRKFTYFYGRVARLLNSFGGKTQPRLRNLSYQKENLKTFEYLSTKVFSFERASSDDPRRDMNPDTLLAS